MIDLICLVADRNLEAAMRGILERPLALGIRAIQFEIIVHPNRDPGCFHQSVDLLVGYRARANHALVVLDRAWEGAPASTGAELEAQLEDTLRKAGLSPWADAVVLDPELEVWVFSDSQNVATALGWADHGPSLRSALEAHHLWPELQPKPPDPKAAVEWVLRNARKPRSSSIYRELASSVSFDRCQDRSFSRFRQLLERWFGQIPRN